MFIFCKQCLCFCSNYALTQTTLTLGKWPRRADTKGKRPPVINDPFNAPKVERQTTTDIIHPTFPRTRYPHVTATALEVRMSSGVNTKMQKN